MTCFGDIQGLFETHSNNVLNFSITLSTYITHSDHDIITVTIDTSDLIRNNRKNTVYDKLPTGNAHTRVIYDCDNIEKVTWENFQFNIKDQIDSLDQNIIEEKANFTKYSQKNIDTGRNAKNWQKKWREKQWLFLAILSYC
ncbi:hypothetical protein RhiirA5_447122 [Rhizophagus irregularis]|uniref:Uncharacterized protein n=1 Tax=Rhizophagus irregularis TaxID=588596 RepID=A0A2N0NBD4_9GLOM|nr:hypothetical protein RhiirA5_447122 [Rhizophagus irregularis]